MPMNYISLEAVLRAAERLLEARQDQMVTADEWDALHAAVAACRGRRADDETAPD